MVSTVKYGFQETKSVRIKTSRTLKSIDGWRHRVDLSQHKYLGILATLIAALGSAKIQTAIIAIFIIAVSVNFAFVQFAFLLLLGVLLLKLQIYRLANVFLRVTSLH